MPSVALRCSTELEGEGDVKGDTEKSGEVNDAVGVRFLSFEDGSAVSA